MFHVMFSLRGRAGCFGILAVSILFSPLAFSKVFYTQESAFEEFYPDHHIEKVVHYLSEEEQADLENETRGKINPVIHSYNVFQNGELVCTVYFDKHLVRTLPETLMISVRPDQSIEAVRVVVFKEPREYIPRGRWYNQFDNKRLKKSLALHHDIDGVTGATLTARATVGAVRRVLTLHEFFTREAKTTP